MIGLVNEPSPRSGDQTAFDWPKTAAPSTRQITVERMVRTGHTTLGVVALLVVSLFDGAAPTHARQEPPRVRVVLVGDSTVTDRDGWGHGFRLFLADGIECVNAAAGGRSSKSYIDEGKWTEALALKGDY